MRTSDRKQINTGRFSSGLRERMLLPGERKILITNLLGSEQERDSTSGVNCQGYGRLRTYIYDRFSDWSPNPLPIAPAAKRLNLADSARIRSQLFQNAGCNWRCWYCFVDYRLLSADKKQSAFLTAPDLIALYREQPDPPPIIVLSGGQPDLTPEWVPWMMEALESADLHDKVFLWSDDNLSTRYYWEHLTPAQRSHVSSYPNYGRVACFKGFDEESFVFNTHAEATDFDEQFSIYNSLLHEKIDMYAYVTLTTPSGHGLSEKVERFVTRLQRIHHNLPLRTVPLKIMPYTPMLGRIQDIHNSALQHQFAAHEAWMEALSRRFNTIELEASISDVEMRV